MVSDQPDLTERMALAAADAVRKRRPTIEGDATNLHAFTLELKPANGGAVIDVETYLSWRSVIRQARRGDRA
jgi:hypothetical protein